MSKGTILIVGAGIGGLSTAIALGQAGYEVSVVEIQPNLHSSTFGVGIIQAPNQLRALDAIGCAEECMEQGYAAKYLSRVYDQAGAPLRVTPGPRISGFDFPPMNGITRPRLHRILTDKALSVGATVQYSASITELNQFDDRVEVSLTDGTTKAVDLVVGADGVRSVVRRHVLDAIWEPRYTGKSAIRINIPRLPEMDSILHQTGEAPDGEVISTGLVPLAPDLGYMYVNIRWDRSRRLGQDELRKLTKEKIKLFGGPISVVRDEYVDTDEEMVIRPEEWLIAPPPWHKGRIVLIGDAVHSVTPNTAQGAAQAVEDGIVLAESLGKYDEVANALTAYTERRYERCKLVVDYGRKARENEFKQIPGFDTAAEGLRMREALVSAF